MAHLWIARNGEAYAVLRLNEPEHALHLDPLSPNLDGPEQATLVLTADGDAWVLVAAPGARVRLNGVAIPAGLAVLSDRDEIQFPGAPPAYFSTETLARVVEARFRDGRDVPCPRCRETIEPGSPAVLCPLCGVWHHERPERPCFTYRDAPCAACGEHSELDGEYRWSPEEL